MTQSIAHGREACAQQARNKLTDFRTAIIGSFAVLLSSDFKFMNIKKNVYIVNIWSVLLRYIQHPLYIFSVC